MNETSPDLVERQIERDRAEIDATLDAIGRRLSPGHLLDQAISYFRDNGAELGTSLARSVRANPLPVILTGVSLAWLITSTSSGTRLADYETKARYLRESNAREIERARAAAATLTRKPGEAEATLQERIVEAKAKALALKRDAGETLEAFRQRVEDYIALAEAELAEAMQSAKFAWSSGTETARNRARRVAAQGREGQRQLAHMYDSQPLIAGAIGIAAGALLAALLPPTRIEDQALGEMGADLRGKVLHETEKLRDGATESARKILSAAADQATIETEKAVRSLEEAVDPDEPRPATLQRTTDQ